MASVTAIAEDAVRRQRFAYIGTALLVLVAASLSNTERALFLGDVVPSAFTAVPQPAQSASSGGAPVLRSFSFVRSRRPAGPAGVAHGGQSTLPVQSVAPTPTELASNGSPGAPEIATGGIPGVGAPAGAAPAADGGGTGPQAPASGPGTGVLTPPNTPVTSLPVTTPTATPITTPTTTPTATPTTPITVPTDTPTATPTTPITMPTDTPTATPTTTPTTAPTPVSPVPEPATWAMMILGFLAIGSAARLRRGSIRNVAA